MQLYDAVVYTVGAQSDRPSDHIADLVPPLSELPWSADFVMQAIEILPDWWQARTALAEVKELRARTR